VPTATAETLRADAAVTNAPRRGRLKPALKPAFKISAALILLLAAWVAYDLYSSRLRAEAMDIRDTKAEQGGVTEED
jgi:hypothetical protein